MKKLLLSLLLISATVQANDELKSAFNEYKAKLCPELAAYVQRCVDTQEEPCSIQVYDDSLLIESDYSTKNLLKKYLTEEQVKPFAIAIGIAAELQKAKLFTVIYSHKK